TTATYVAMAINLAVAIVALTLSTTQQSSTAAVKTEVLPANIGLVALSVYLAIGLSGLSALGAEVVWTRLLSLIIGGTVYTFSIILAVFLIGLGLGSSFGSFLARESRSPRVLLGICQLLLAAAIAWTAYMLARSL